jgi:hypothetical protein
MCRSLLIFNLGFRLVEARVFARAMCTGFKIVFVARVSEWERRMIVNPMSNKKATDAQRIYH